MIHEARPLFREDGIGAVEPRVKNSVLFHVGESLVVAILFGTLTLPYVGGFPLAYLLIVFTILLGLWLLAVRLWAWSGLAGGLFLSAVGLLAAAFLLGADATSGVASVANFAPFLLFPILAAGLSQYSSPEAAVRVANFALAGSVLSLLVASYQVFGLGMSRAAGMWSDEIWSAGAALVQGFVAIIGLRARSDPWRRIYLIAPIFAIVTVLLSGSRGPMLAILPLVAVACFGSFRRPWVALFAGLASTVALIALVAAVLPGVAARLHSVVAVGGSLAEGSQLTDYASEARLTMLRSAWEAFLQSPWLGYGWYDRMAAVAPYGVDWGISAQHFHLHNEVANFAIGAGVLGIAAYLLILLAPIAGAVTSARDSQRSARVTGCAIIVVAYACFGTSNSFFGFEYHNVLYVVGVAILLHYCKDGPERSADRP